jgi:hypothetical protein
VCSHHHGDVYGEHLHAAKFVAILTLTCCCLELNTSFLCVPLLLVMCATSAAQVVHEASWNTTAAPAAV